MKGETRYYDQAVQQIKNITEPTLGVGVSNIFLPDSEVQFGLSARNLKRVDFALYPVNLTRDVRFTRDPDAEEGEGDNDNWIQKITTAGRVPARNWSKSLNDKGDYKPVNEQVRIEGKLPVGAYLLEAKSGALSSRELVLVTDVAVVLKSSAKQALVYFSNALTGAPIANANVALWESYYTNSQWHWRKLRQTTNSDGLAAVRAQGHRRVSRNLFAVAECDGSTARLSPRAIPARTVRARPGAFTPSPIAPPIARRKRCSGNSSRAATAAVAMQRPRTR